MITCYYYIIPGDNNGFSAEKLLAGAPFNIGKKIVTYKDGQEQLRSAAGRILLAQLLQDLLPAGYVPGELQYDSYLRPFLPGGPDFNIAHSGRLVLCAVTDTGKVGVDAEQIKPVDIMDYPDLFTPGEWKEITGNNNVTGTFYRFWVRKEAVLKAIGKGIYIAPAEIEVLEDVLIWEGRAYYLHEIDIHKDYKACLAVTAVTNDIRLKQLFL
ncbi:4'-phosphopantetheinyl transferase family protein [Chitinophagaceae bacterium MMS25-I14]